MSDREQFEASSVETAAIGDELPVALPEEGLPPERQYCIFRAGRERYSLAVLDVEEVVDWPPVTPLPLAPSFLMGIFNLRGSIVPVVDIAVGEGRRPDLPPKRVVVAKWASEAGHDDLRLGIAADEVIGTYSTREPLLVDEAPREVPHCCGMLRHNGTSAAESGAAAGTGRLAMVLDLRRVVEAFPLPVI